MNESRRQLFHTKAKMRQVWPIILFLLNLERYLPTKLSGSAAAAQWCDLNVLVRGFVISDVAFLRAKPERRLNWTGRTANSKKASRIGRKVDPAVQILWNNCGGEKTLKLCKFWCTYLLTTNKFFRKSDEQLPHGKTTICVWVATCTITAGAKPISASIKHIQ